jgi:hypothetical protein
MLLKCPIKTNVNQHHFELDEHKKEAKQTQFLRLFEEFCVIVCIDIFGSFG